MGKNGRIWRKNIGERESNGANRRKGEERGKEIRGRKMRRRDKR